MVLVLARPQDGTGRGRDKFQTLGTRTGRGRVILGRPTEAWWPKQLLIAPRCDHAFSDFFTAQTLIFAKKVKSSEIFHIKLKS